jgi:hypothetical protein
MKYRFLFKEINYGSIVIEANNWPEESEIKEAIMKGNGIYNKTEYEEVSLEGVSDRPKLKQDFER